jgi:hypothetical protein
MPCASECAHRSPLPQVSGAQSSNSLSIKCKAASSLPSFTLWGALQLGWEGLQGITVFGYGQPNYHNATMMQSACAVILLGIGGLVLLIPSSSTTAPPPAPAKVVEAAPYSA